MDRGPAYGEEGIGMTLPPTDGATTLLAVWALGCGLLLLALCAWRFPRTVLPLIFLVRPLLEACRLPKFDPAVGQAIINASGVLVPAALFGALALRGKLFERGSRQAWGFLLVFLIISLGHGLNAESGTILLKVLLPFSLLLYPALAIDSEEDVKKFLRLVGYSALIVIVLVLLDWSRTNINPVHGWVQDIIPLKEGGTRNRLASVFGVPTTTSFWLFQFLAVGYLLFETDRPPRRWIWLGICAALSVPLYYTFARAAWIGAAVLVALYNLLKGRRLRIAVGTLAFGAAVLWLLPNVLYRMQNLATWKWRFLFWLGYLKSISVGEATGWLVGIGLTDLPRKNLFTGELFKLGSTGLIENSFVFVLVGAGAAALLLFVAVFLSLAKTARRLSLTAGSPFVRDFGIWSLSLLAAWFVMGMSGDMVTYAVINWYFYAFFGCLLALGLRIRGPAAAPAGNPDESPRPVPEPAAPAECAR